MATKYKSVYDAAKEWNDSQAPYNPYDQYANAMRASADATYNNAMANADLATEQSIASAQNAYKNERSTYGANAERYLASGLTGSGVSEYADSSAYATMRGEIANANAVNAYAQQNALYNRDQAYAQADAYKAEAEQNLYNNLLSSVMSGNLTTDLIDGVASAYGLRNPKAIESLKNAAGIAQDQYNSQLEARKKNYQDAYNYILENGITDAETADRVAQGAGYSEDSEAYASILAAAEQNAERQKTISDAGKVTWSATNVNGARNDDFRLKIGDTEFKLSTKSSNEVTDQSVINRLNEMATGDKTKRPTATNGKNNSTDNAGAIQILNDKMYMFKQNRGVWVEVTDRNKNNKVETAIDAWKQASTNGRFAYYNAMTDDEKQKLIASAFGNENTQEGLDALAKELKSAGVSEDVINKAMEARKSAYGEYVDSAIPNQYKGVPGEKAYEEHLEDLKNDMLTDEQKQKVKDAFVKNQGINGLRKIFEDRFKSQIRYDSTGKAFNGMASNISELLANGGLKGFYASLGYNITDQQAKDLELIYKDWLTPQTAEQYNEQLNRKR